MNVGIVAVTVLASIAITKGQDFSTVDGYDAIFGAPAFPKVLEVASPYIVAKVTAEPTGKCDQDKFISCQVKFHDTLGFPKRVSSDRYLRRLKALTFARGAAGVNDICQAANSFLECLEDDECLKIGELRSIGYTFIEAAYTHYAAAKTRYECSSSVLPTLMSNYTCLVETAMDTYAEELNGCGLIMQFATPQSACVSYQNYISCIKSVYTLGCGAEIGSVLCEADKVIGNAIPACKLKC